jgi:hypothetical protein
MVGFSLQYELSFTKVLTMLDLGGIPLRRRERQNGDPIIVAGGPCTFNPAPMETLSMSSPSAGEELIRGWPWPLRDTKGQGRPRRDILEALARIDGLYIPDIHTPEDRIRKRIVMDLDACITPQHLLTPLMKRSTTGSPWK